MNSAAPSRRRRFDTLLSAGFVLALVAPWIDALVRSDEARGPAPEQRKAEPLPPLPRNLSTLYSFPERYERHFNDTLGLRDQMLRWHSVVQLFGFGVSPASAMVLGPDRWLLYTGDRSIPVYRGLEPFTDSEIAEWLATWERRRDFLAQRGIQYLFVIAPNKETIYPERMPARFNKLGPTRLDQIAERLAERPDLPVLDLRAALSEAKRADVGEDLSYLPLGTHWNGRGHCAAYNAVAAALHPMFAQIEPHPIDALERFEFPDISDSWAERMYIGDLLTQPNIQYRHPQRAGGALVLSSGLGDGQLRVYARQRDELPRGVMFHDSFGGKVAELLSASFQSLACVQRPGFDLNFIERARPDVVIELFVERVFVTWKARQEIDPLDTDRERFQQAERALFHLDIAAAPKAVQERGDTHLEFDVDTAPPRIVITPKGNEARFSLPRIEPLETRDVLVRAAIESPGPAYARFYFHPHGEDLSQSQNYRWALIERGSNELFLRFAASEMSGPIDVRLVGLNSAYELRALDARAADLRQ